MPRSPDSTTDTYLDVLRTIGVPDAALRRHHDAGPETPLRAAIDGDRGAPTADLLAALVATGRVLDLRNGLAPDDGDRLTAAFGRFGFRIDCEPASDESAGVGLRILDLVTGDADRVFSHADAQSVQTALEPVLFEDGPIELVELLDGCHLVAESRELHALAASYGPRIQPYDDPLLVPDAAIDVESDEPRSDDVSLVASAPDDGVTPDPADSLDAAALSETAATGDSFGEVVAAAGDEPTGSTETALADSGPSTPTIEDDEALAAASSATVGGGPRRTVSTNGIDEVFDQLESASSESADTAAACDTAAAADTAAASATRRAAESTDSTDRTMSESSDTLTDASASSDDADTTPNGLTGGPTRTVSSTSADDILSRATGDSDFETIAAEEDGADPDAVLADAEDVPPALADAGASPKLESAPGGSAEDDPDESERTADCQSDDPAARTPAAPTSTTEATSADAPEPEPAPPTDAESSSSADAEPASSTDAEPAPPIDAESADAESAATPPGSGTPTRSGATQVGAVGRTEIESDAADSARDAAMATQDEAATDRAVDASASADESDEESGLGDELLAEDVELRRGTETVDGPTAPAQDPAPSPDAQDRPDLSAEETTVVADTASDDPTAADGPLAAAGGVDPARSSGDLDGDAASAEQSSEGDSAATAGTEESDADPETETETGLVGRITSTIFGR